MVEQKRFDQNITRVVPSPEDRSYAEWFAWAKRGGAPAAACHAAAQAAFRALAAGKDVAVAAQWAATRTVPDGAGGRITVPGRPWHFRGNTKPNESGDGTETETVDTGLEPDRQPARQGEHNEEVLREFGYSDDEITEFTNNGVLVRTRDTNC